MRCVDEVLQFSCRCSRGPRGSQSDFAVTYCYSEQYMQSASLTLVLEYYYYYYYYFIHNVSFTLLFLSENCVRLILHMCCWSIMSCRHGHSCGWVKVGHEYLTKIGSKLGHLLNNFTSKPWCKNGLQWPNFCQHLRSWMGLVWIIFSVLTDAMISVTALVTWLVQGIFRWVTANGWTLMTI